MRGEEKLDWLSDRVRLEIPPRARGRVGVPPFCGRKQGNTPACAGKRRSDASIRIGDWKYPRVRGEERLSCRLRFRLREIPPRARGRDEAARNYFAKFGNTPACAGKRSSISVSPSSTRKYPRVRGEEMVNSDRRWGAREIPPRARGRVVDRVHRLDGSGNTPACAGKSVTVLALSASARKYPRVRGEEFLIRYPFRFSTEIPPRARGRANTWT